MKVFDQINEKLFISRQRKALDEELKRLEIQYKTTRKFPEYGTAEDDTAQEVETFQQNLSLQNSLKNLIKDTKAAIKKIDQNKYGKCEQCHGEIEQGRLKAYPAASLCVSCASKKFSK